MKLFLKRLIDITISSIGILLLIPAWIIIAIAIKLDSKGDIFYAHTRIGKNRKEFTCLKFRTMYLNSEQNTIPSDSSDKRITRVGNFLRKTSLDETPQLINVLAGQMSIVGPRPALLSQVKEFTGVDFDKLLVKPGLTGWTQVNGRNSIPYKKRLELDSWYAKNWSIFLDLKIILKTFFIIFKQEGIYNVK